MNCIDYLNKSLVKYPSLYSSDTLSQARFMICDHFFNVIGNGIGESDEELLEHFERYKDIKVPEDIEAFVKDDYFFASSIYWEDNKIVQAEYSWEIPTVNEEGKANYPEVKKWIPCGKIADKAPYPNFEKKYSLVWRCPVYLTLDNDWITQAMSFYSECRRFFVQDDSRYSSAFPKDTEQRTKQTLKEFEKYIAKYETHEEVSKAYEAEYTGDVHDFLAQRWKKEKIRILEFIDETIEMLKTNLK